MGSIDAEVVAEFLLVVVVLLQSVVSTGFAPSQIHLPAVNAVPEVDTVTVHSALFNMEDIISSVLHDFQLRHTSAMLDGDLGYWIKPCSTTWFSQFLMLEYDDSRWVENFWMSKEGMKQLSNILAPHLRREDTRYRKAIPVVVRVALSLYKITQGAPLLHVSKAFAVGKSTASYIIKDFIAAVNIELQSEIAWPTGNHMAQCIREFKDLCGLPSVVGAIDGTHFAIRKPAVAPEDYYYFKSGGYSIQAQAVVNRHRRFLDVLVGMPGSINDVCVLCKSGLYHLATTSNLFNAQYVDDGFAPYLIGDKGYPLYPWLVTPYRDLAQRGAHTVEQRLFNRKLRTGRCVVENAFGILKGVFRELRQISETNVTVVPDLVVVCCLLHNLLLGQSPQEVARLLGIVHREGPMSEVHDRDDMEIPPLGAPTLNFRRGDEKKSALARYLCGRRNQA